jgi:uncharacterized repeat protein (TIGR04052 family)
MTRYILKNFLSVTFFLMVSVASLSGCSQEKRPTIIIFQPVYENVALTCKSKFHVDNGNKTVNEEPQHWKYQQLQFYIHGVEVNTKNNGWQPWAMTTNENQSSNTALLGGTCNEGNEVSNWQLELVPLEESILIADIRFILGVPFELNHLNPLTQPSPLNDSSMFWGWRGGHKFMRVELKSQDDDWLFHLGSTGCKALSPVRAPKSECLHANRVKVSVPYTDKRSVLKFDLTLLLRDIALTRENSCQSAPDEESCKVLFKNLDMAADGSNESLLFKAQKNG